MKSWSRVAILVAVTALAAPAAMGSDLWLHVRVTETGARPTTVRINLPFALVERAAPLIEDADVSDGDISWNGDRMEISELRQVWSSLRSGKGTVSRSGAVWTLEREAGTESLVVREEGAGNGAVVRMPAPVVDALLADANELDLAGAVAAITKVGSGELVAVDEDGTRVRIWLDRVPEGEPEVTP